MPGGHEQEAEIVSGGVYAASGSLAPQGLFPAGIGDRA